MPILSKPFKLPSQKSCMIWSLFALFGYSVAFRDYLMAGIVAGVFTITINYLFKIRSKEKTDGIEQ